MDEARASCALDISGRPLLVWQGVAIPPGVTGGFEHELAEEFMRAVASTARLTLHITLETGTNAHHLIEGAFKAFARALARRDEHRSDGDGGPVHQGHL